MTKDEYISYWLNAAENDWRAVNVLFLNSNYLQSLFFCHLVIEKIIKAIWVKDNESNHPPRTHNLLYLLDQTKSILNETQLDFLLKLNNFQIDGRYPDYQNLIYKIATKTFTNDIIEQTDKIRICLIKEVQ